MNIVKKTRGISLALAAGALLAACQSGEQAPQPVEERAQERWDLLVAGEYGEAWEYLSPSYRELVPRSDYAEDMRRQPMKWLEAEVVGSECEADACRVLVEGVYQPVRAQGKLKDMTMPRELEEQWMLAEGAWWHVKN